MIKKTISLQGPRIAAERAQITGLLTLTVAFACALTLVRIIYTGRLTFISMVWNLFLSWIPFAITQLVNHRQQRIGSKLFLLPFLLWLLFIPNSFYILTDLFHLADRRNSSVPMWFDLLLIMSFAWSGLMLGVLSLRDMEKQIQVRLPRINTTMVFIYPVMLLSAFGVYIGRYLRYNSWDVITNPLQLSGDILDMLLHPRVFKGAWIMVFGFAMFTTLIYATLKKIGSRIQ